jgi:hypothetical protein
MPLTQVSTICCGEACSLRSLGYGLRLNLSHVHTQLLTYYLKQFWITREKVDPFHSVAAHISSTEDVGTIPVISALIKEAAVSLRLFTVNSKGNPLHPLSEIARRVVQEHPELRFENRASSYHDPVAAWQYLQFRCGLSGVSLEWCRKMALEVSPEPSAASLFEGVAGLRRDWWTWRRARSFK